MTVDVGRLSSHRDPLHWLRTHSRSSKASADCRSLMRATVPSSTVFADWSHRISPEWFYPLQGALLRLTATQYKESAMSNLLRLNPWKPQSLKTMFACLLASL